QPHRLQLRIGSSPVCPSASDHHLQRSPAKETRRHSMSTVSDSSRRLLKATEKTGGQLRKASSSRIATAAAFLIAAILTIPTFGLFVSSFREANDIKTTGWWTALSNPSFTLENYAQAFVSGDSLPLSKAFLNSLVITIPAAIIPIIIASLAAYAFAWTNFKGRNTLFILVFALQIVPIQMALV